MKIGNHFEQNQQAFNSNQGIQIEAQNNFDSFFE
jgi:hypothetical protein